MGTINDGGTPLTGIPASIGQKTKATAMGVTLASDEDALPTTNATQLPASLGQGTEAQSLPVVLPSDQTVKYVNTARTAITVVDTNSAPSGSGDGVAVTGGPRVIHLCCETATSAADGPVVFSVYHWFDGPDDWFLDRSFGNDGVVDYLLLSTTPKLLLSFEHPGDRIAVHVTTSSAVLTLTVTPVDVVEGF